MHFMDNPNEGIFWILENQYTEQGKQRILERLKDFQTAGVNWIRILVSPNWGRRDIYANPLPTIQKVNDLMALTREGKNAGKFTIELVLDGNRWNADYVNPKTGKQGKAEQYFVDPYPYRNDKAWFKTWIDHLNFENLGMIMFAGDTAPCKKWGNKPESKVKCYESEAPPSHWQDEEYYKNNGRWVTTIYAWFAQAYPSLNVAFEVGHGGDFDEMSANADWVKRHLPAMPVFATALYIHLGDTEDWRSYREETDRFIDEAERRSEKKLWIDEIGYGRKGNRYSANDRSEARQKAYFDGVLASLVRYRKNKYPTFAWVAGDDYRDHDPEHAWYGLLTEKMGSGGHQKVWSPAWNTLSLYYNLQE